MNVHCQCITTRISYAQEFHEAPSQINSKDVRPKFQIALATRCSQSVKPACVSWWNESTNEKQADELVWLIIKTHLV